MSITRTDVSHPPLQEPTSIEALASAVERTLEEVAIAAFLARCLDEVTDAEGLLRFCARFSLYNRPFPAAVLALASGIHFRHDAFADRSDPIVVNQDRSSTIASHVLFAAEDEYAGPDRSIRLTHRAMAQRVVADALAFSGVDLRTFNDAFRQDDSSDAVADALRAGYGVGRHGDDASLFRGLGFHIGSERLAQIEFSLVDEALRARFPTFVERACEPLGPGDVATYEWIRDHTVLEVEHYRHSLIAAELAARTYVGDRVDRAAIAPLLLEGLAMFMDLQRQVFAWLLEDGATS